MKYPSLFILLTLLTLYASAQQTTTQPAAFTYVEHMPTFPGGDTALVNFVHKNIQYPRTAKDSGIEGTVVMQFIINEDGHISNTRVMKWVAGGCVPEATRIMQMMPRWNPGRQNNQNVKVKYSLSFWFMHGACGVQLADLLIAGLPLKQSGPRTFSYEVKTPVYPGGDTAMVSFIKKHMHYPKAARDSGIQGSVLLEFFVDTTGILNDIKVIKELGGGCNAEAIRLLKLMHNWIPGEENGKNEKMKFTALVNFKLPGDEATKKTASNTAQVFTYVGHMPSFPGGDTAMIHFIRKNTNYPKAAKDSATEGTVILSFVVNEDGSISDIQVLRGVKGGCTAEAIRVVKLMPKWNPGIQNDKEVKVRYTLPFAFKLKEESSTPAKKSDTIPVKPTTSVPIPYEQRMAGGWRLTPKNIGHFDFTYGDVAPVYPGGDTAYRHLVKRNLFLPKAARDSGMHGIVRIKFIINEDGTISDIEALSEIGGGLIEEAERVVKLMPRWKPMLLKGKPVKSNEMLTFDFEPGMNYVVASFPGGAIALDSFLKKNIQYPQAARDSNIQGTVQVAFTINEDGSLSDIRVLNGGIAGGCNEEALRVVKLMPPWLPTISDSVKIKSYYNIPVEFKLPGIAPRKDTATTITAPAGSPSFPGGTTALVNFLQRNIHYPQSARENNIQGTVYLSFTVNEDGSISDINTVKGLPGGCTEEAIRVIKLMPPWIPAVSNGVKAKTHYNLPVVFKLN